MSDRLLSAKIMFSTGTAEFKLLQCWQQSEKTIIPRQDIAWLAATVNINGRDPKD